MSLDDFPTDWLIEKITIADVEKENPPLGYLNDQWEELKSLIVEGDEIWEWSTPGEFWNSLCGREGIVLLRGKKEIYEIVTIMN